MKQNETKKTLSLKSMTKSSVWDIQENDVFRLWEGVEKDTDARDDLRHYQDIIRSAFLIEELSDDSEINRKRYEKQGYKVGQIRVDESSSVTWAIKKKTIIRITDLTYENIRHISAAKLMEVLERNFGGGWESIPQSIQDIIENAFDISTTTLPKDRLHKKGGMYEKKVNDGYEVLEVEKGSWVEAIFAKLKPESERPRMKFETKAENEEDDDADVEIIDDYNKPDEDDDDITEPNDDDITEENYSTMMELDETDPDEEAAGMADYSDE
jgi:hypothetical protein